MFVKWIKLMLVGAGSAFSEHTSLADPEVRPPPVRPFVSNVLAFSPMAQIPSKLYSAEKQAGLWVQLSSRPFAWHAPGPGLGLQHPSTPPKETE